MICKRKDTCFVFLLVFLEINFLNAQVANKTSNQTDGITSVESRLSDFGRRSYPNFQEPGSFENSPSNYQGNSFQPYGNQNQPDYTWRPDTQNPNQGGPYQETGRYPNNYQEPGRYPNNYQEPGRYPNNYQEPGRYPNNYPGNYPSAYPGNYHNNYPSNYPNNKPSNYPSNYPNNYPSNYPNNYQSNYPENNPSNYPGNYPNNYPNNAPNNYPNNYPGSQGPNNLSPDYNGGYSSQPNQNAIYQQPPRYNMPDDRTEYPSNINGQYQNGAIPSNEDGYRNLPENALQPVAIPIDDNQNSPRINVQNNSNIKPAYINSDFKPDDILDASIKFPGNNVQPNQYPSSNNPGTNNPNNQNGFQAPYQGYINPGANNNPGSNQVFQGNYNNVLPNGPNNPSTYSVNGQNANDSPTISAPVFVPSPNGQGMFVSSIETPFQRQCQRSCRVTSEYNPICGTNNITYDNPGRLYCARNCGVVVNMRASRRCPIVA